MVTPEQIEVINVFLDCSHLEIMAHNFAHDGVFGIVNIDEQLRMPKLVSLILAFVWPLLLIGNSRTLRRD